MDVPGTVCGWSGLGLPGPVGSPNFSAPRDPRRGRLETRGAEGRIDEEEAANVQKQLIHYKYYIINLQPF